MISTLLKAQDNPQPSEQSTGLSLKLRKEKDANTILNASRLQNVSEVQSRFWNEELAQQLKHAPFLRMLSLRRAQLDSFPLNLCQLTQLTHLEIGVSKIEEVPDCICALKSLSDLSLWDSRVGELPECMASLPLKRIDLSGVRLNLDEFDRLKLLFPESKLITEEPCDCDFD